MLHISLFSVSPFEERRENKDISASFSYEVLSSLTLDWDCFFITALGFGTDLHCMLSKYSENKPNEIAIINQLYANLKIKKKEKLPL